MIKLITLIIVSILISKSNATGTLKCANGAAISYTSSSNTFSCETYNVTGVIAACDIVNVPGVPNNAISTATNLTFSNADTITDISSPKFTIPQVPTDIFRRFPYLISFTMIKVHLKCLVPDAFKNCKNLTNIEITGNRIGAIQTGFAQSCVNLNSLVLTENRIPKINSGAFKGLSKLTMLNLQDNRINCIPRTAFSSDLPSITNIILKNNMITTLDYALFRGLKFLNTIDLTNNQLTSIAEFDLTNCAVMLRFLFDENPIDGISKNYIDRIRLRTSASQPGIFSTKAATIFQISNSLGCVNSPFAQLSLYESSPSPLLASSRETYYPFEECFALWTASMATPITTCV